MTTSLFKRIDTVFLPVTDVDRTVAWFQANFDLTLRWKTPNGDYACLNAGETPLTLAQVERVFPAQHMPFNFYASDITTAYERLKANGVDVGPLQEETGVTWFAFRDPDGNELGVCYFPE